MTGPGDWSAAMPEDGPNDHDRRWRWPAARIALAYLGVATVWIFTSGWLVSALSPTREILEAGEKVKGVAFVLVTALLLYAAVGRELRGMERMRKAVADARARMERAVRASHELLWEFDVKTRGVTATGRLLSELGLGDGDKTSISGPATWHGLVHPDDTSRLVDAFQGQASDGEGSEVEARLKTSGGAYRWFRVRGEVSRDANGQPERVSGSLEDVHDRVEARQAIKESEQRFRAVFERNRTPMWIYDPGTLAILAVNDAAVETYGYAAHEFTGMTLRDIRPAEDVARDRAQPRQPGADEEYTGHTRHRTRDGRTLDVLISESPIPWHPGGITRLASAIDVTAEVEQRQALAASERSLVMALRGGQMGAFDWDLTTGKITWSEEHARIWGMRPDEFDGTFAMFASRLHPEDAPGLNAATEECLRSGSDFLHEFRIVWPDGTVRWIEGRGQALRDGAGTTVRMVGIAADITARRSAEQRLRESEARLQLLIRHTPLGVIFWDSQFNVASWNPAAERIFGYTSEEAAGQPWVFIVPTDVRPYVTRLVGELLGNRGGFRGTNQNVRKDGRVISCEWYNSPLVDEAGNVIGVASVAEDITARLEAERRQTLMVRELDHRVKNNLASITALAAQTARSTGTQVEFVEAFAGRLRAMARLHGLLTRTYDHGVDVRAVVSQTLEPFIDGPPSRTAAQGPAVQLDARVGQALALALNELSTNATKYGALSVPEGRVDIRWALLPAEPSGSANGGTPGRARLELTWAERGGPTIAQPTRRGFGTDLIQGMIAHELGGAASVRYEPAGLVCVLTVPLESPPLASAIAEQ